MTPVMDFSLLIYFHQHTTNSTQTATIYISFAGSLLNRIVFLSDILPKHETNVRDEFLYFDFYLKLVSNVHFPLKANCTDYLN